MSGSQEKWRSDNTYAPKISHSTYHYEKAGFAGAFICSILYGIIVMLFFKCMVALSNPVHRKGERIKWGLISYTVIMFSITTIQTAVNLHVLSISYIDNRDFSGTEGVLSPGPYGYRSSIAPEALFVMPIVLFFLNNWLADGLLLYRCYVIYSKNLWVVTFPCLMYLGSLVTGTISVYQSAPLTSRDLSGFSYFPISLSLNILLTLMIVIRLILHTRSIRTTMGISGIGGSYKATVTMLVESSALFAVSSLLVTASLGAESYIVETFYPILSETQVIAPLLVILRVANKGAFTSNTVASERLSSFKARSQGGFTGGSGALPDGDSTNSVDRHRVGFGIRVETTTDSDKDAT